MSGVISEYIAYSFAKTPLKAAQAPLATARASQGVLRARTDGVGGGSLGEATSGGMLDGRRGSAWLSMLGGGVVVPSVVEEGLL